MFAKWRENIVPIHDANYYQSCNYCNDGNYSCNYRGKNKVIFTTLLVSDHSPHKNQKNKSCALVFPRVSVDVSICYDVITRCYRNRFSLFWCLQRTDISRLPITMTIWRGIVSKRFDVNCAIGSITNVPVTSVSLLFSHLPSSTQHATSPDRTTQPGLNIPNSGCDCPQIRAGRVVIGRLELGLPNSGRLDSHNPAVWTSKN